MGVSKHYGKSITEQIRDGERSCAEALLMRGPSAKTRKRWIKAHLQGEMSRRSRPAVATARGYLWTCLIPLLFASGCSWNGAPKEPIEAQYAECKRTCKGTCTIDGQCLRHEPAK